MVKKIGKTVRVVGPARAKLATEVAARYEQGASVRELAEMYGRSYGFIHRLISESGTPMRRRGGPLN